MIIKALSFEAICYLIVHNGYQGITGLNECFNYLNYAFIHTGRKQLNASICLPSFTSGFLRRFLQCIFLSCMKWWGWGCWIKGKQFYQTGVLSTKILVPMFSSLASNWPKPVVQILKQFVYNFRPNLDPRWVPKGSPYTQQVAFFRSSHTWHEQVRMCVGAAGWLWDAAGHPQSCRTVDY